MNANQPIGIFDSGIGGLTVAKAVRDLLPAEQLIYFGDTAHLPYGDKSTAAIQAYSVKIVDVLLKAGCKLILIACNSASAAAFELVKEYAASRAHVFNVIDPVVEYLGLHHSGQHVGLIGTKQTVHSGVYAKKIDSLQAGIAFSALATPLLAPMIEEGFQRDEVSDAIIHSYLGYEPFREIRALVLGCTHYPLIKKQIADYFAHQVHVIDSSEIVAQAVKAFLHSKGLLNELPPRPDRFLVSDFTSSFQHATSLFFGSSVRLERYPLWE
ncbi:Glutamate racemase [Lunatimonas lonarensis]|uniref:Glutamate racemase n=1 Tax=Lunatimonas lonarensis TaxID=1232681 RepID=R7ZU95_9BACT|nr:glutamate racemase [Lunatimonas lonarensis]EON77603.1 Glutamate racemase [Lunatimonas lonarensis]